MTPRTIDSERGKRRTKSRTILGAVLPRFAVGRIAMIERTFYRDLCLGMGI